MVFPCRSGTGGEGLSLIHILDVYKRQDVDILLMESTYGGRFHEAPSRDDEAFCRVIRLSLIHILADSLLFRYSVVDSMEYSL